MKSMNLDILSTSETRWTENGIIRHNEHSMIYFGGETAEYGIWQRRYIADGILSTGQVRKRAVRCKLKARPFNIVSIHVYSSIPNSTGEINWNVLWRLLPSHETNYIFRPGDFNTKVGITVQFCESHQRKIIVNAASKHHKRMLYLDRHRRCMQQPKWLYCHQI